MYLLPFLKQVVFWDGFIPKSGFAVDILTDITEDPSHSLAISSSMLSLPHALIRLATGLSIKTTSQWITEGVHRAT